MKSKEYQMTSVPGNGKQDNFDDIDMGSDDRKLGSEEGEEENPFVGMTKEELLKYSSAPCWRRFRAACLAVVVLAWLGLLVAIVVVVMMYPKCTAPGDRTWWQSGLMYRIYVPSFKDSDGDGIGDLKGIESKLDYLKEFGVGVVSLSPIFSTDDTSYNSDYSIVDHNQIHPNYGTLADLESLISTAHKKDMKIVLDFIPNQTSRNHTWFESSQKKEPGFQNFYVWSAEPTNWYSYYHGLAWELDPTRNEYFLHQMLKDQPDLNLRSSQVQAKLQDILEFWLSKGVDGFYVRQTPFLYEDYDMRNETQIASNGVGYSDYSHNYTYGLPESLDILTRWKTVINQNSSTDGGLVMLADIRTPNMDLVTSYYGNRQQKGADLVLNNGFFYIKSECLGPCVSNYVRGWRSRLLEDRWATWIAGDEDTDRMATRFPSRDFIKAYHMLTMLLPGTPIIFYGDEILLENFGDSLNVRSGERQRHMRTLMQWTSGANAGFTCDNCSTTWIPVDSDANATNVDTMMADKESFWHYLKNLTTLRQEVSFRVGGYREALVDDHVFSFVRDFNGETGYLVAINFGKDEVTRNIYKADTPTSDESKMQEDATVEMVTGSATANSKEDSVKTSELTLKPLEGVVVSWDYVAKEEL